MRRQFEEQMRIVEDGGDPKNVFREPDSMPDLIHGGIWDEGNSSVAGAGGAITIHGGIWDEGNSSVAGAGGAITNFRFAYHKGYDADRYGLTMPDIIDLMQRVDHHLTASQV